MRRLRVTAVGSILMLSLALPFFQVGEVGPDGFDAATADALLGSVGFYENRGQVRDGIAYHTTSGGLRVGFAPAAVWYVLTDGAPLARIGPAASEAGAWHSPTHTRGALIELTFPGARHAAPEGRKAMAHQGHFLLGDDSAHWTTGVPSFQEVVYLELYRDIELAYRVTNAGLKYEFRVHPGGDVSSISLRFNGSDGVSVTPDGELLILTPAGPLREAAPVAFEDDNRPVACSFRPLDARTIGFDCDSWRQGSTLIIDPLVYATFLGGAGNDFGYSVAVDGQGSAYITGWAGGSNFPTTPGAYDPTQNGGWDAIVAKLTPDGSTLVYATYLGGFAEEIGHSIAVDAAGSAYVAGHTWSSNFPTTPGAFKVTHGGVSDAFVAKLSPDGDALQFSTFLGGTQWDEARGVAVDGLGRPVVVGMTVSSDFPTTPGAFDVTLDGTDAFVVRMSPAGDALVYAGLLGGSFTEFANDVALDVSGDAFVVGWTDSVDFPTTPGVFDETANGLRDTFVARIAPDGTSVTYATLLGGTHWDIANAVAVAAGRAVVGGLTNSTSFPTTPGAYATAPGGDLDGYVVLVSADGGALDFSTFLGGPVSDYVTGVGLDAQGDVYATGYTEMTGFPVTPGAFDTAPDGGTYDAFIARLDATGSTLEHSTFLGGQQDGDYTRDLAMGPGDHVFVVGESWSWDFPTSTGAFQETYGGTGDPFIVRMELTAMPPTDLVVDTVPPGLQVEVDGVVSTAPVRVPCPQGKNHTVSAPSPQLAGDSRHAWMQWSDAGARTHLVVCTGSLTLVATFATEFLIVLDTDPPGLAFTVDGTEYAGLQQFWWVNGSAHAVEAVSPQDESAGSRRALSSWSDGGQRAHLVISMGPTNLVATFGREYLLAVESLPGTVSGGGWYPEGALASLVIAARDVFPNGTHYRFVRWAGDLDGSALSAETVMDGPKDVRAEWREVSFLEDHGIWLLPLLTASGVLVIVLWRRKRRKGGDRQPTGP